MGKGRDGPYSMMHQKSRIKQRGGLRKKRTRRTGHLRLDGGPPPSPVVGMPRNVNGRLSCHCVRIETNSTNKVIELTIKLYRIRFTYISTIMHDRQIVVRYIVIVNNGGTEQGKLSSLAFFYVVTEKYKLVLTNFLDTLAIGEN